MCWLAERTESVSIFQIPLRHAHVIPGDRMLTSRSGKRVTVHYAPPAMNTGALLAKDGGHRYPRQLMRPQLVKTADVIKSFARDVDEKEDTTRKLSLSTGKFRG